MDETFHGWDPFQGVEPTCEVLSVDTLMVISHKAHGDFSIRYSDTVLNAGNGRVWADWAPTGARPGGLVALPYIGWLSQRHRLPLKFGWLELCLRLGRSLQKPYRVKSWYEASAIPVSEFYGHGWQVRAWCAALPGENCVCLKLHLSLAPQAESPAIVIRGATTLGEEAGCPFDGVNGTVGDCQPLPSELTAEARETGVVIRNAPAGVSAEIRCSAPIQAEFTRDQLTISGGEHPDHVRSMTKQQIHFEIICPITAGPHSEFALELELLDEMDGTTSKGSSQEFPHSFGEKSKATGKDSKVILEPRSFSMEEARAAWLADWSCLRTIHTPDARLTAGLNRAAIYASTMLPRIDAVHEAAGMSDHVSFPVDCARDSFHCSAAMLLLKPDLVRRHLAFYFLDAIPRSGAGKSYVATGESRGHRKARLLDLASYPLLELWRYWCATGDDEFVAQPGIRRTALAVAADVAAWQDPRTGMLTSTERSSDEPCVFPCFVPGNAMFCKCLEYVAQMCEDLWSESSQATALRELAGKIRQAIYEHAIVEDEEFGRMFAFEVGAPGEFLLYDQADMPNLLSLARLGFCPPDDPIYQNTVRFAYSRRNQGYRGTLDGKYRQLCDGSKTMPFSPWSLGTLGQLMSGTATPADAAQLLDWLRDALTPALQLPEISDKHTAQPIQRYWFAWPTAMLLIAYIETICGVKIGRRIRVEPLVPAGWTDFSSPRLQIRGRALQIEVKQGRVVILLDGREVQSDLGSALSKP